MTLINTIVSFKNLKKIMIPSIDMLIWRMKFPKALPLYEELEAINV